MNRPSGERAAAVLTFSGAMILALGSFAFFLVSVLAATGDERGASVRGDGGNGHRGWFPVADSRGSCRVGGNERWGTARMGADGIYFRDGDGRERGTKIARRLDCGASFLKKFSGGGKI